VATFRAVKVSVSVTTTVAATVAIAVWLKFDSLGIKWANLFYIN
jgi:hypothetical protein